MMDTHTHMHTRGRWRGIGGMIVALVALMCVLVSGMSGIVAANDGPMIDTITLSASTVARGDTVTVNAHITDTVADVLDTPVVFFALPDAFAGPGIPFTRVSGDARDGQYHADWVVSPLLPTGKYPVREVRAYDGNGSSLFVSSPDPRVGSLMLTVTDAPIASVTVTVTASATASPVATVAPTMVRVTSTRTLAPSTATSSRPTPTPIFTPIPIIGLGPDATITPTAPTATATAAARVTVLPAITAPTTATAPSTATRAGAAAAIPTAMRQSSTTARTSTSPASTASATAAFVSRATTNTPSTRSISTGNGPSLASIIIVPSTIYPGDALTVTARITAGSADVADLATLRYRLPDGTDGPFAYLRRVHGTARDGTYEATIGLSPFYPAGTYTLGALTVADNDGNTTMYTAAMRPDATFTITLFVADSAG